MKKLLAITFVGLFLFSACKKDDKKSEDKAPDNIEIIEINDAIGVDETITISETCPDMIFSIENTSKQVLQCEISGDPFGCDGGGLKIMADENGDVIVLNESDIISVSASYESVSNNSNLSLENFAGQGEKYIGFASNNVTSESPTSNYGWIKIELNGLASNLKVHEMAVNRTVSNSVKAGQVE